MGAGGFAERDVVADLLEIELASVRIEQIGEDRDEVIALADLRREQAGPPAVDDETVGLGNLRELAVFEIEHFGDDSELSSDLLRDLAEVERRHQRERVGLLNSRSVAVW